ncbi:MAG: hypothetical protein Q8Q35_02985 [Nanoarchaeota archaeon]|nr:hypothetical protein [Nanoarchaeota archaeon]
MNNLFNESFQKLENYIKKTGTKGYEQKDIYSSSLLIFIKQKGNDPLKVITRKESKNSKTDFLRYILSPFYQTKTSQIGLRKILRIKKTRDPKAIAMLARCYINLYKKNPKKEYKQKIYNLLSWLQRHRSPGIKNYSWGYHYRWPNSPTQTWPAHTPQSTMTTFIANAFIDAYILFNEKKFLNVAESCAKFCIEDLKIIEIDKDKIYFSYSNIDEGHVINVNAHIGALLARMYNITKKEKYLTIAKKAFNSVVHYQQLNGTWTYRAPPEPYLGPPDNYHTGDILEYLYTFKIETGDNSYDKYFKKGLESYINLFFEKNGAPKMTDTSLYPIDIHCAAQAIITFSFIKDTDPRCEPLSKKIALWTIQNMQDKKGYFYNRIYNTGIIDKTPFFRWCEAWMMFALSHLTSA